MRRRSFLAGLGFGLVSRAISARAQTGRPRILWLSTEAQPDPFVEGFREGLRNHGYVDGQNVDIDLHYAPRQSRRAPSRHGRSHQKQA
jgi:putative tryptophan/tyrosine transport system substrate-binding protein